MFQQRLERLRSELKQQNMDCLVVMPGANLTYLTGLHFHMMERPTAFFFPAKGKPIFAIPFLEAAKITKFEGFDVDTFTYKDEAGPLEAFREAIMALPEIQRVGVEYLRMRVTELKLVQRYLPAAFVADGDPVMDTLRISKDDAEIAAMRQAIAITEAAIAQVIAAVQPGMTEKEIASMLTLAQRDGGGEEEAFGTIVGAGANSANPHYVPGDYRVQSGDALLFDLGTTVNGYVSDITRTFFVGEPSTDKFREVYETVKAANAAGRQAAGPGVPCQEVDRATRKVIVDAGYGDYFRHRTGHGIGLDVHEQPYIVEGHELILQPGMTFTVEPGIYLPGEIGVRIEDDVLITEAGAESLTTFSRDLTVIG